MSVLVNQKRHAEVDSHDASLCYTRVSGYVACFVLVLGLPGFCSPTVVTFSSVRVRSSLLLSCSGDSSLEFLGGHGERCARAYNRGLGTVATATAATATVTVVITTTLGSRGRAPGQEGFAPLKLKHF